MRNCFAFLFYLSSIGLLFAQKQANIWYFGQNAGLDFNSGAPIALTDGLMNTLEGCASIADTSGNLLFYTDGTTVWNKYHDTVQNGTGLLGDASSTQSAIIVRKPQSDSLYYIFTVDRGPYGGVGLDTTTLQGLNYSIVDITANNDSGVVIQKNVLLVQPTSEKVTGVTHGNGESVWIITQKWLSDSFYAFSLTSNGIQDTVISKIGSIKTGCNGFTYCNAIGYLKASPRGNKLLSVYFSNPFDTLNYIANELFDFDNCTGIISNRIALDPLNLSYGCSFSPDGSKIYIGAIDSIYQYDLLAGNSTANDIISSRIAIVQQFGASLQLGADGKIYISANGSSFLSTIDSPNIKGIACSYSLNSVSLGGQQSAQGLPDFIESFFTKKDFFILPNQICLTTPAVFKYLKSSNETIQWNFGDVASGSNNTDTNAQAQHLFSDTGIFTVTLIINGFCIPSDTLIKNIHILPGFNFDLGNDTSICPGDSILIISGLLGQQSYNWSTGDTSEQIIVSIGGVYQLTVFNGICYATDSMKLQINNLPQLSLPDTNVCVDSLLILDLSGLPFQFNWSTGDTSKIIILDTGTYLVQFTDTNLCVGSDSFQIQNKSFDFSLGKDSLVCDGESIQITTEINADKYLWSTGEITQNIIISDSGEYILQIIKEGCPHQDSILIGISDCSPSINIPQIFSPNGDHVNDVYIPIYDGNLKLISFQIFNRWGVLLFETKNTTTGWDGNYNDQAQPVASYIVYVYYKDENNKERSQKSSFVLLR